MLRVILILSVLLASCGSNAELTPPASFGGPIGIGNRAFLLTWQRSSTLRTSRLLVDLWAFDTLKMKPLYRSRLQSIPGGALEERFILGVQNKTLWLLMPEGPFAVDLDTGALAMNPDDLTRLNPELRGLLPKQKDAYQFTSTGLSIKTIDARAWHVHPNTYLVSLKPNSEVTSGILPTQYSLQSNSSLLERGYAVGEKWIGLLSAKEAVDFPTQNAIGGLDFQSKRALYSARVLPVESTFGPTLRYSQFQVLTPEFLAPSVLIQRNDPSGVFILHKDLLGEKGLYFISRFNEPESKVLWTTALKVSEIYSVLPGQGRLLIYGSVNESTGKGHELFSSVNWVNGAVTIFDQQESAAHPVGQSQ